MTDFSGALVDWNRNIAILLIVILLKNQPVLNVEKIFMKIGKFALFAIFLL